MKTILQFLDKILDLWSQISSRLKSIGSLLAVILAILFLVNNGCKRQQIEKLIEKTTGLNVQNDILMKQNKLLDRRIEVRDSLILDRERKIDSISNIETKLTIERDYWKRKSGNIADDLSKIPNDSSYKFLQSVYNYPGTFKYPFNGQQVKGIHKTYLENKYKDNELLTLESSLMACKQKEIFYKDKEDLYEDKENLILSKEGNYRSILSNKDEEIKLLKKHIKKEGKWFAGFGVGPDLGVTYMNGSITPYVGVGVHYNIYKW